MELTLENLKKLKKSKSDAMAFNHSVVKEMRILLQEELEYLDHWQKQELSLISRTHMKERAEFIKLTLNKIPSPVS